MSSQPMPTEIIDAIIDQNHDDRAALLTSALVSRQWVHGSRHHVFTEVSISHHNARELLQLLSSPHCSFSTVIRGLNIELVPGSQRWLGEFGRRLSSFRQVGINALALSGSRNTHFREEGIVAISQYGDQIRHLSVGTLVFDAFADFAGILCAFTSLEHLTCAATFRNTTLPREVRCASPLQSLKLVTPAIRPVLDFLLAQGVLSTIASISLDQPSLGDFATFSQYLHTPNSHLQSLSIKMDAAFSGVTLDKVAEILNLSRLEGLRHLSIDTSPNLRPNEGFNVLAHVPLAAPLQTLHISVELLQGMGQIDLYLSETFATLQNLVILGSQWADARQFLPRCNAKGIVKQI